MLTKLYVKESYESHAASLVGSSAHSSLEPAYRPPLQRGSSLLIEDAADMFLSYRASQDMDDEDEEEGVGHRDALEGFSDFSRSPPGGDPLKHFAGALDFKPFDSLEQGSHSSSASNAVDAASPRATDDEGREYHPVSPFGTSPFDMELGGAAEAGAHTPAGSLANTPSPLEHFKPFSPLRPRKSSSLSNVLDDGSCGTDPPTGDTISNTSNPQVLPPSLAPPPPFLAADTVPPHPSPFAFAANSGGGAVQPADQHHLLGAVEPQRAGGGRGRGVEGEGAGLLRPHQAGLLLPAGAASRRHQAQVSDAGRAHSCRAVVFSDGWMELLLFYYYLFAHNVEKRKHSI